ncbi:MAG: hypothetical protein J1E40_11735 [Oscillospiraceae bacterium]|nr:hypothetical protein [Oscillospiraceae bacterium]
MSEEHSENDVVKLELPEYEEKSFPFPDAPTESSFAENKDEIFRRNMIIAAKDAKLSGQRIKYPENFGAEEIYPQDMDKIFHRDKKSGHRSIFTRAAAFLDHSDNLKIVYTILLLTFVVIMTILLSLTFQLRGRVKDGPVQVQAETIPFVTAVQDFETVITQTQIINDEVTEVIPAETVSVLYEEETILY